MASSLLEPSQIDHQAYALRSLDAAAIRQRLARAVPWYAKFLENWLPDDKSGLILDLPCGAGNLLYALRVLGFSSVQGFDLDPGQIDLAVNLGLPARVGDAFDVLARQVPGSVSRIFSLDFLEHVSVERAIEFCKLAHSALVPGGLLLCRTPCADGPFGSHDRYNDLTHRWGMTSGAAAQLFALAGFAPGLLTVVGEAPVPYKVVNRVRLWAYSLTTGLLRAWLEFSGIGAPHIWTRSMWVVAQR